MIIVQRGCFERDTFHADLKENTSGSKQIQIISKILLEHFWICYLRGITLWSSYRNVTIHWYFLFIWTEISTREPEISQFNIVVLVDHDVLCLHIPMSDPFFMQVIDSLYNLSEIKSGHLFCEPISLMDQPEHLPIFPEPHDVIQHYLPRPIVFDLYSIHLKIKYSNYVPM